MLKENWRAISFLERLGDFLIIVFGFFTSYFGRDSLYYWNNKYRLGLSFSGDKLASINEYYVVLFIAVLSYLVFLEIFGAYSSMRFISKLKLFFIFLISSFFVFIVLATNLFLLKADVSRGFIVLFCVLTAFFLFAERLFVVNFLRWWRKKGLNYRSIIVCGIKEQAFNFASQVYNHKELGIKIRAFVDLEKSSKEEKENFILKLKEAKILKSVLIVDGASGLERVLKNWAIDEVIFTDVIPVMKDVEESIFICAQQGVSTSIVVDLFSKSLISSKISYFGKLPLIHFEPPPGDRGGLIVKRILDVALSLMFLILFSPIFLLVAILVKVTSKGPIIFVQKRIGLHGRIFSFYKFRSMYDNAEKMLDTLKEKNEMTGPVFKIREDPRITPLGKFLRKYSLDELPQLINVVRGEMSLVGPRPPIPGEVNCYDRITRRRLSMRPGLTCIWQVNGRNAIKDFNSWVEMDLNYIDNWSLFEDFKILVKTVPVVLLGNGV